MNSYVNHSKTAKKIDLTISSDFPKQTQQSAFKPRKETELTRLTTGWRCENTDLEWRLKRKYFF